MKSELKIIKIGGKIISDNKILQKYLNKIKNINENIILIHGGGNIANKYFSKHNLPIKMLTIHVSGGEYMMKAAMSAVSGTDIKIFGVTALTSLNDDDTKNIFQRTASDQVNAMLDLAEISGIDGVVCSPHELKLVRNKDSLLSITPGIRLQDTNDDQKRIMTPKKAIDLGADYLVIGRPITKSKDIKKSLDEIYLSIQ